MKKLRVCVIGLLTVAALMLSLNLIASAREKTEKSNAELKSAQDEAQLYKEQLTELQKKLDELKSEQYVNYQTYEDRITELESKLLKSEDKPEQKQEESDAKYTYTLSASGITITGYTGSDKILYLPASIDGVKVTEIGREAFKGASFNKVVLPNGIEKIDWFAFSECTYLECVEIPDSVKKIEYGVFDGVKKLVISCSNNSYAHKYAKSYGYSVEIK